MDSMLFVRGRQTFCRRERKIIKAHYMLAYKCGLRRLRSRPRRPIGIAGVTKSIEARGVYLDLFTIKMFSLFSFCFLYFCLILIFITAKDKTCGETQKPKPPIEYHSLAAHQTAHASAPSGAQANLVRYLLAQRKR